MWQKSFPYIYPHEVAQIRCHNSFETIIGPNIHGNLWNVHPQKIISLAKKMIQKYERQLPVLKLEIVHTHPTPEYLLENNKGFSLSPLGKKDLEFAHYCQKIFTIPIIVKALTSTGICYKYSPPIK